MLLSDKQIISRLKIKPKEKVLDVGGSMRQHDVIKIDTLVDIIHPEESPYGPSKLKATKFVKVDITKDKLPFFDKQFDVCLCTHTLEDLPSPFLIMDEMSRVAKRGLIVTPSMGQDMVFSEADYTNWMTGLRRVPGHAHHKWFFNLAGEGLEVIPKNYPVLYTHKFQIVKWRGKIEMEYYWSGHIDYREFASLSIHKLIDRYKAFCKTNSKFIKFGLTNIFIDHPVNLLKAFLKKILKRGYAFHYKNTKNI